ncbi:MAG: histidine phosphatase family protein [Eubacteriales bacterium]|nr:histidine phosphatase family protein [Eubacteriales bacterium]
MKQVRSIYLVRHGKPDFPGGIRRCIGRTELPLSETGRQQARELAAYFARHPVEHIFTSPLIRSRETAELLADGRYPVQIIPGLQELDMGEWENVPIKQLHRELGSEPERGEGKAAGLRRFQKTMDRLLEETTGDIVCVAHAGVSCCYLSSLLDTPLKDCRSLPQPYGGFSRILVMDSGKMQVADLGIMPKCAPDERECQEIWDHYHTPERVRNHCKAVCKQAVSLGEKLRLAGCRLDMELIRSAALLHDVAREKKNHAMEGYSILVREGYLMVAEIVKSHHDLTIVGEIPNEAEVVYLADKLTAEDKAVTLEKRFADSRRKCIRKEASEEALAAHERRYREAKKVERKILNYIERRHTSK